MTRYYFLTHQKKGGLFVYKTPPKKQKNWDKFVFLGILSRESNSSYGPFDYDFYKSRFNNGVFYQCDYINENIDFYSFDYHNNLTGRLKELGFVPTSLNIIY